MKKKIEVEAATALLRYKFAFEHNFGYDALHGKPNLTSHTNEFPSLLFDLFCVRCDQIIDITIQSNPISINFRYYDGSCEKSYNIALRAIEAFNNIYSDIQDLLAGYI